MDARTKAKAFFFGANYQQFLDEQIGNSQLPADLGGTHAEWPVDGVEPA